MSWIKKVGAFAAELLTYVQTAAAGTAPPAVLFNNPVGSGEAYEIMEVDYNYDVAGGASAAADVKIVPSGTALSAGTSALASTMDLTAAARTIRKATLATNRNSRIVMPGQSVAVVTSGTLTALTGLGIGVLIQPLRRKTSKG